MRSCDVLIVGGGPAGSSAAWHLVRGGASVLVLDQESFPRLKLCAGWITPEVVRDLQLDISSYPHRFLTFQHLHVHLKGMHLRVPSVQHSIRRFEFDAWLLQRSQAEVVRHSVRNIRRERGVYVIGFSFPVVPQGAARIRTQMSAAHTQAQLDLALEAFTSVGHELGVIQKERKLG